jgi:hypothetical protein
MEKILENFSKYIIYSDGRIYSLRYNKFLSPGTKNDGYLSVILTDDDGNRKSFTVHRLVALAFIPNPDPEKFDCINHKDENKLNNDVSNLEWCDRAYNNNYGHHKKEVVMCDIKTHEPIQVFNSIADASRFLNVSNGHANIVRQLKGKGKSAYGYFWKYA